MPKVHTVKALKNYPEYDIKKGETYYWWKFRYGKPLKSKTYPKPAQLTQSDYLIRLYSIQENISDIDVNEPEDLETTIQEIISDLDSLKSETEDKLNNMPEQLQSSSTGELLQERIDDLENAISELENIDFSYDENEDKEEWINAKISEIQSISFD